MKVFLTNQLEALSLVWDGNSTVSSTVHGRYLEGTAGLCGTWDDDLDNDQTTKEGEAGDLNDFGWSWKYKGGFLEVSRFLSKFMSVCRIFAVIHIYHEFYC